MMKSSRRLKSCLVLRLRNPKPKPKRNQTKSQHVEKLPSFLLRQLKRWAQQVVLFWALLLARWVHWLALALDLRVPRN
jgi:hypothetical protein